MQRPSPNSGNQSDNFDSMSPGGLVERIDTRLHAGSGWHLFGDARARTADRRNRRRATARRGPRLFWPLLVAVVLCIGLTVFGASRAGLEFARLAHVPVVASWLPDMRAATSFAGLEVDQVSVRGQRHTADGDIFDALNLRSANKLVGFDVAAARKQIEALPWIRTASITRVYPGQLDVDVVERSAFALWRNGDSMSLIDRDGSVLGLIDTRSAPKLPVFSGEGAAPEAAGLLAMIGHYRELSGGLVRAEFVAMRRWTLHLRDGVRILLPAGRAAMALRSFMTTDAGGILGRKNQIIDLRAAGRISVRSSQPLSISELVQRGG